MNKKNNDNATFWKIVFYILIAVLVLLVIIFAVGLSKGKTPSNFIKGFKTSSSTSESSSSSTSTYQMAELKEFDESELLSGKHHVEINVKDYGTISVELDADNAPITVTNFIDLASEGFYDGLTFHRVIDGFMIQGGDPNADGTGGAGYSIKGEFSGNGIENPLSHTRGAISMARRTTENDGASSQFFICQEDESNYLDGNYAVFGYVTDGMDVVDAIAENTPVQDSNGTVEAEDQPVIESIKVID